MSVAKVSEVISSSSNSFDEAISEGLSRANKTLKNVRSAWIKDQEVMLDGNGSIREYRVTLKLTFILED